MSATDEPVTITVVSGSDLDAGHADLCVMTNDATVSVAVPTYNGYAHFTITVAICDDGESWLVEMPFLAEEGVKRLPDGHDISNGAIYLGTPDEDEYDPGEFLYVVGDDEGVIERFKTHDEAAQYITDNMPADQVEAGMFYIDGPERED